MEAGEIKGYPMTLLPSRSIQRSSTANPRRRSFFPCCIPAKLRPSCSCDLRPGHIPATARTASDPFRLRQPLQRRFSADSFVPRVSNFRRLILSPLFRLCGLLPKELATGSLLLDSSLDDDHRQAKGPLLSLLYLSSIGKHPSFLSPSQFMEPLEAEHDSVCSFLLLSRLFRQ